MPYGTAVVDEPLLVCLEAVPVDVAALGAGHHELPFGSGHHAHPGAAVGAAVGVRRPPVDEGAGIAGIVQHLQDARVLRQGPDEVALVRPRPQPAREPDALIAEETHGLGRAASAVKGLEHQTDGSLHLGVGIEVNDTIGSIHHESYRRTHLELAAPGLVQLSAPHARLENVQFGFAHVPLSPAVADR